MSLQGSGTVVLPHTTPIDVGTCCCERSDCTACYREKARSETRWREVADRRPNWTLANGQAI